jgi:hypothetical protein
MIARADPILHRHAHPIPIVSRPVNQSVSHQVKFGQRPICVNLEFVGPVKPNTGVLLSPDPPPTSCLLRQAFLQTFGQKRYL